METISIDRQKIVESTQCGDCGDYSMTEQSYSTSIQMSHIKCGGCGREYNLSHK